MKLFFTILSLFNILNACIITFFDKVKADDTIYGHLKFHKEVDEHNLFDESGISCVFFLEKNADCIGETFACWKHCNRMGKHRTYDAYVVKKEYLGKQEYHICVRNLKGKHSFDMIIAKNEISEDYEIYMFRGNKNLCIFIDTSLANKECCCTFSGNDLVKLLQKKI